MRVLLINKFWKPVGGVEEHCRSLVELLAEEGHEVVRFGMDDPENEPPLSAEQTVSAVSFHGRSVRERSRAAARACLGLETRRAIRNLIAQERFDIAHVVHAYHQLGMTFLPLLRKRGIPVILDLHDYKVGCPRYLLFNDHTDRTCTICMDRRGAWVWAPTTRRCWNGSRVSGMLLSAEALSARVARAYSAADCVVVRNELQVRAAERGGVARDRIRMIPPWISVEQNGAATKEDYILFVGRLVREKGVETLIRASAHSGVPIRVVGDGPLRPALASLIASSGADVELAGWRSHDEVLAEVARAKALVVPSVWPEIFGLVICEAFAAGVPVIGSDIGAITGLLSGERGYLFPPGDVSRLATLLRQVNDDQTGAATRAENARRYAKQNLTYERWRDQYREVYRDLSAA